MARHPLPALRPDLPSLPPQRPGPARSSSGGPRGAHGGTGAAGTERGEWIEGGGANGVSGVAGAQGAGALGARGSGGHRATGATGGAGPRSAQPGEGRHTLSPGASLPCHQRRHQLRRVRPRVPRCSRPRAPGSNNEAERRDRGPGLRRRQLRGPRISIFEAFLFVLLCSFSIPNARHIPGRVLSSGATEAERGCPGFGKPSRPRARQPPEHPCLLPCPARPPWGDPPGKERLGREPGRGAGFTPEYALSWVFSLESSLPSSLQLRPGCTDSGARLEWAWVLTLPWNDMEPWSTISSLCASISPPLKMKLGTYLIGVNACKALIFVLDTLSNLFFSNPERWVLILSK